MSVRNGLAAVAITGGALAVALPTLTVTAPPSHPAQPASAPDTVLQLVAGDVAAAASGPAVLPAMAHGAPLPSEFEVAGLIKAAGMASVPGRTGPADPRRHTARSGTGCDADLDGLDRVKAWARSGARFLSCLYDEPPVDAASEGPKGLTVDIRVTGRRGDRIAACALANREKLGVAEVLWRERANDGDGWERLSDDDADEHRNHVRISFTRKAPDGDPVAARCR